MNKLQVDRFTIEAALGQSYSCSCGRVHSSQLEHFILERDAAQEIPRLVREHGCTHVLVVADRHTMAAAGEGLLSAFAEASDLKIETVVFEDDDLVPDESALERLRRASQEMPAVDCYLALGSGTINDLTRYVSYEAKKAFMVFATAPSMDGYASGVSPLILNQMKQTFNAQSPFAIVADPEILAAAPDKMIQAGVGDVLGKYSSLLDWQLSALVFDEYYCAEIAEMVSRSREAVRRALPDIAARKPEAIRLLFQALIEVGIAMDYSGNSRPASGAEHHLAHFWEMQFLFNEQLPILHGLKVGVALPIILDAYAFLAKQTEAFDFEAVRQRARAFDTARWYERVDSVYGPGAAEIKRLAETENLLSLDGRLARIERIEAKWPRVLELARTAPTSEEIQTLYRSIDFPASPAELGVDSELRDEALRSAKDLRSRYTILRLFDDLGMEFYE